MLLKDGFLLLNQVISQLFFQKNLVKIFLCFGKLPYLLQFHHLSFISTTAHTDQPDHWSKHWSAWPLIKTLVNLTIDQKLT